MYRPVQLKRPIRRVRVGGSEDVPPPRITEDPHEMDIVEATKRNKPYRVAELLHTGIDPNTVDNSVFGEQKPILLYAVQHRDHTIASLLLGVGAEPNTVDRLGNTPLTSAVRNGNVATVQLLLLYGADPNKHSPLALASYYGDYKIMTILLDQGADVNGRDSDGHTPLHWASIFDRKDAIQLLLNAGADPTLKNRKEETPAQRAKFSNTKSLLIDAEYAWNNEWTPERHAQYPEAKRLERVGALSAFRTVTGRKVVIPPLPLELQHLTFEHL